ncbi:MAG: cytochrome c biogenesis protein CcdA [Ruminococcaceae bacterium]|nr:cytochrome c biogenesis protein CcdA [Oscillospiraceae bacterium]
MEYVLTFIEGIISFISPCMLPMLPIYVSYFAGNRGEKQSVLVRALCFVVGFTLVFTLLGVFAGAIGMFLSRFSVILNIICGLIVVLFGLSYLEIIPLSFLKGMGKTSEITSAFSAFVFGMIYSVSLTPCVGAFLGSALMQAASSGGAVKGALLLLFYSLGLGIPFVISAILLDSLSGVFGFIKKHYKVINTVCGIFLVIVGICMAFGVMNKFLSLFS